MDIPFPAISYAECVRTNSTGRKCMSSCDVSMSWFDQVENFQNEMVTRSNSMSTISDGTANCRQRLTAGLHRNSISHSMDSGRVSDASSDIEQCSKPSKDCAADVHGPAANTTAATLPKRPHTIGHHMSLGRRESVDSCHTSSSAGCSDPQCTINHNQLSLMCQQRWATAVAAKAPPEFEEDEGILARRQKQIDYGKNTIGYELYMTHVPREERTRDHPQTPDKTLKYSRRAFDGLVRVWRKQLHKYDPSDPHEPTDAEWQNVMAKRRNTD